MTSAEKDIDLNYSTCGARGQPAGSVLHAMIDRCDIVYLYYKNVKNEKVRNVQNVYMALQGAGHESIQMQATLHYTRRLKSLLFYLNTLHTI